MEMVLTPINSKPVQDSSLPGGVELVYGHMDSNEAISSFIPPGLSDFKVNQNKSPFIEANTEQVTLSSLKEDCIIPVFSKDNEITLSHQELIKTSLREISKVFRK